MESNIFNDLYERYKNFKADLKGGIGEFAASLSLKHNVSDKISVVRNVFVPLTNDKTAEIDLVIIHSTGIYVVECKNYNGWIFGSDNGKTWTQSFNKDKKYQFYNPILQNRNHIKALSCYLDVPTDYFVSYIVFGEQCELKKVPDSTEKVSVMKLHSLPNKINLDIMNRPHLFSDSVVDLFSEKVNKLTDITGQKKRDHIEQVRKDHPNKSADKNKNRSSDDLFVSSFFKF